MPGEIAERPSPVPGTWLRPHQALNALLAASILLPALLFGILATYDRVQTLATAERGMLITLDTLHGHAEKVLDFQALVLGAADQRLSGLAEDRILADAAAHHAYLKAMSLSVAPVSITIFGADGGVLVDSVHEYPSPGVTVRDRAYFRWHRENPDMTPRVAGLLRSWDDGQPAFFVTRRRSAGDGTFLGVIAVGVQQSSFLDYWQQAAVLPKALVSIIRADGALLARWPTLALEADLRMPPQGPLAQAIRDRKERVAFDAVSPIDGVRRIVAYRSLGHFPVNIALGIPLQVALAQWYRRVISYGGFALATSAALLWLCLLARQRTRELAQLNTHLEERVQERTAAIKASEARVRLLAREVDHRARNALAVVQATLQLTPKTDLETYVKAVSGRVSALARAQTLLSEDQWRGANLQALLTAELTPFVAEAGGEFSTRAELDGQAVLLPPAAAQPLAMAMHELATNALKHGALSVPGGQAIVSWRLADTEAAKGDLLTLRWEESKGPPVLAPARRGFGFRMLDSVVCGQLGGRLSFSWVATGLVCEIEMSLARLGRTTDEEAPRTLG